jgi:hypothetical protein
MADLRQGPYLYDKESMILNDLDMSASVAEFRRRAGEFECVITDVMNAPMVRIFLETHPTAGIVERHLGKHSIYILLANSGARG